MTSGGRKVGKNTGTRVSPSPRGDQWITSDVVFLMCLFYASFIDQKKEVYKICLTLDFQSPTKVSKSGVYFSNVC